MKEWRELRYIDRLWIAYIVSEYPGMSPCYEPGENGGALLPRYPIIINKQQPKE